MKTKFYTLFSLMLILAFVMAACGSPNETAPPDGTAEPAAPSSGNIISNAATAVGNTIAYMLDGNVQGEIGKTYSTKWFEFTIKSLEKIDSYAGYEPEEGYELYDVVINEKCTYDESTPMGTYDFYMDEESWPEYVWAMDPIDDTMMPLDFFMEKNDVVEYHMVFETPVTDSGLMLCYTEYAEDESTGATFTIKVN